MARPSARPPPPNPTPPLPSHLLVPCSASGFSTQIRTQRACTHARTHTVHWYDVSIPSCFRLLTLFSRFSTHSTIFFLFSFNAAAACISFRVACLTVSVMPPPCLALPLVCNSSSLPAPPAFDEHNQTAIRRDEACFSGTVLLLLHPRLLTAREALVCVLLRVLLPFSFFFPVFLLALAVLPLLTRQCRQRP